MPDGNPLPASLHVPRCTASMLVTNLIFSGDSPHVADFNTRVHELSREVEGQLVDMLCGDRARQSLEREGSGILERMSMAIMQLAMYPPEPSPRRPAALEPLVAWGEYPPVVLARAIMSEIVQSLNKHEISDAVLLNFAEGETSTPLSEDISLQLHALFVEGLDSLRPPGFAPQGGPNQSIGFSVAARRLAISVALSVDVKHSVGSDVQSDHFRMRPSFSFLIEDLAAALRMFVMASKERLDDLVLGRRDLTSCVADCVRRAVDRPSGAIGFEGISFSTSRISLRTEVDGTLERDLGIVFSTTFNAMISAYLETLLGAVEPMFMQARFSIVDALWTQINRLPPCNSVVQPLWDPVASVAILYALTAVSVGVFLLGVIAASVTYVRKRLGRSHPSREVSPADSQVSCLAFTGQAPSTVAIMFPFACVAASCLLAQSQVGIGATLNASVSASGSTSALGPVYAFSLSRAVEDTWAIGSQESAVLTAIFSGLWPHVKLLALLAAWLLPPRLLSLRVRGGMLTLLDYVGKYSLFESWLLLLALPALSMNWQRGGASLRLALLPTTSFYGYFFATLMTILLTNVACECHQRHRQLASRLDSTIQGLPLPPGRFPSDFMRPHALRHFCPWPSLQRFLAPTLIFVSAIIVLGVVLSAFEFKTTGVGATIINPAQAETYSVVSAALWMENLDLTEGAAFLVCFRLIFFSLTVIGPVLQLLLFMMLWLLPLRPSIQDALITACHRIDTWLALDLFALVVGSAHFGAHTTARQLASAGRMGSLCTFIESHLGMDCTAVDVVLRPGFAALATAGLLALIVPKVALRLCIAASEERDALAAAAACRYAAAASLAVRRAELAARERQLREGEFEEGQSEANNSVHPRLLGSQTANSDLEEAKSAEPAAASRQQPPPSTGAVGEEAIPTMYVSPVLSL
eukprot:TRINITY_DN14571_c0_g1_i3.p1 TRINITY_DN14571_c0_g1~~TRINITY_DN14571_c0_g1_i3.p1  ORF type:complete len:1062 (-),score=128.46 TRINITY_DN14571_c0_g1_i3:52-2823(-)